MFPALIQARPKDSVLVDHVPYKSFELLYSNIYRKGTRPFQDEQRPMLFNPRNIRYKRFCVSLSDTQTNALLLSSHLSRSFDVASGARRPLPQPPLLSLVALPRLDRPLPCTTLPYRVFSFALPCPAAPCPVQFSPVQTYARLIRSPIPF